MRVLCISEDGWEEKKEGWLRGTSAWVDCEGPTYGEECTVTGQYEEDGCLYYLLKEWSADSSDGYEANQFIPMTGEKEETASEIIYNIQTVKPEWMDKYLQKYAP